MTAQRRAKTKSSGETPSLRRLLFEDMRSAGIQSGYQRELKELYHFYLDEEMRTKLADMGRFRRAFALLGWLFKSLMAKLSPGRRLLLLVALVLAIMGNTGFAFASRAIQIDFRPWGFLLVLFVLMLELKDKLDRFSVTIASGTHSASASVRDEAMLALTNLGMPRGAAEKALDRVDWEDVESRSVPDIVKEALRHASGV